MLERREIVGGACVTEEIAPGCRASTTSYIASMLRPEVIRDLRLERHGLRMVPCEPGLQAAFEDGTVVPWWSDHDRAVKEFASSISEADAASFDRVHRRLHALARYLQPFFLEEPPNLYARGWAKVREGSRAWRRFRKISGDELADLVRFTTGSLGEFVERHFETDRMRRMYLANNVYGMHAPPYMPGTAIGLLFHLLSGGAEGVQGFYGHVMGGMGSITQAMAAAVREAGGELRVSSPVARVRGARRSRDRGRPGERRRARGEGRAVQRRSQTHVPRDDRARRVAGGVPRRRLRDQDGRAVRQGELRAVRGAGVDGDARGRGCQPPFAGDVGAHARGGSADLRPPSRGRDPRRAVGRLRDRLERRRHARATRVCT